MLDPLTAISLASSVVQFTDFGIKLVTGTIELYVSADGANKERSNFELKITQVRNLADQVLYPLEHNDYDGPPSRDEKVLRELATSCKEIASDLLSVLDNLKVKRPVGLGRKLESLQKAVAALTPWNKDKIASLDKRLRRVQEGMFHRIQFMMRWKRYDDIGATWNHRELSEAFRKLGQEQSLNLKFCFFVDGVDEYDGEDYTHVIDVLKNLNASASIKICLSSRPWNIFIAAFGADTDHSLLLEDHNGDDIQRYVKNRFEMDKQFAILQSRDTRSSNLVDQIVCNAQGVFLWVKIVVSNLLRGLSNDDNLADLQKRLESFPTTLTAYFQHMFDNIDDLYREETSEILLMCPEGIQPLSLLALWFYEQERVSPDYALRAEPNPLSKADVTAVFESIHKRINARVQDLLEIKANTFELEHLMYTVRFSHRTVKDFLLKPDMLKKLTSWRSKNFDARAALCKATLATIKSLPSSTDMNNYMDADRCWKHVSDFFTYVHLIEQDGGTIADVVIDDFERVIHWFRRLEKHDTPFERFVAYSTLALEPWAHWVHQNDLSPVYIMPTISTIRSEKDRTTFFFALAVEANLKHYVEHKLATKPYLINTSFSQRPILDRALRPPLLMPWIWRTGKVDPDMIRLLLLQGANANEELTVYRLESPPNKEPTHHLPVYARTTVWALFLHQLHQAKISNVRKSPESVQDELEATTLMMENGATADIRPWSISALNKFFGGPIVTPSDVFHEVFPPRDAVSLDQLLRKNRPWAWRQACSWLRQTVLLWLYRDIYAVAWLLIWLYPIFFNPTFGVILPMVIIPTVVYFLWIVWPFIAFVISGTAPVLLPALILSDWIPVLDFLIWCNNLLHWRNGSLVFKGHKQ
ncbi:MAG: hypothetical protein ALECFALPRED_006660 [Alectoria fallacina]|uniref:DUF7791 domain-containing protein n=1 Tax=Alectoria fallacina TaxID=1903189 RepID=A0A8H3G3R2_9LECA|nr:MAG: hypothetical protein ALECFALPRED_006660 [Alectoria fallacina]